MTRHVGGITFLTSDIAEKMSGSHSASLHSSTGHLTLNTRLNLAQAMKHRRKP